MTWLAGVNNTHPLEDSINSRLPLLSAKAKPEIGSSVGTSKHPDFRSSYGVEMDGAALRA